MIFLDDHVKIFYSTYQLNSLEKRSSWCGNRVVEGNIEGANNINQNQTQPSPAKNQIKQCLRWHTCSIITAATSLVNSINKLSILGQKNQFQIRRFTATL
jgi:hypothetical protein